MAVATANPPMARPPPPGFPPASANPPMARPPPPGFTASPNQMLRRVAAAPQEMVRASPPASTELRLSDLERIGRLGMGGFATVTKVRHRRTGAVFALRESFNPDTDAEEEAEALRRAAGSPHVVRCHAVLRGAGGEPACVLELMDAGSLETVVIRRGGRGLPEPAVAEAAARCLAGLAHLHSRGVAHLDVKPDNLLANSRGDVKIADFNASRVLYDADGEPQLVCVAIGTVEYFCPERFAHDAYAPPSAAMAADVWSLGVTVLQLSGWRRIVPAGEAPTFEELKQAICHGEPPSVPEDAEASSELRGFVAACMQKEPWRRATVAQLLAHPFIKRRDVEASSRALRELIVETL
ncbi:hypothetical protein ACP70R_045784 [Stipagrostis hirtigluma subsp. patula]